MQRDTKEAKEEERLQINTILKKKELGDTKYGKKRCEKVKGSNFVSVVLNILKLFYRINIINPKQLGNQIKFTKLDNNETRFTNYWLKYVNLF